MQGKKMMSVYQNKGRQNCHERTSDIQLSVSASYEFRWDVDCELKLKLIIFPLS